MLDVAEVRKPGPKKFLQQMVEQAARKLKPGVRVLEPQELATAEDKKPGEDFVVLVRPDYAVAAVDVGIPCSLANSARNPSTGSLAVFMTNPECSGMNADGVGFERLATGDTAPVMKSQSARVIIVPV